MFAADHVDAWADDGLIEEFRRLRQEAYDGLARDIEQALKRAESYAAVSRPRAPALQRLLDIFRERLVAIERIDFFGSAGRDRVLTLLGQLESRAARRGRTPAPAGPAGTGPHRRVRGPALDHAAAPWRRSHGLGMADPALHRSPGTLRICRRPRGRARTRACPSTCSASNSAIRATAARSKHCAPCSRSRNRRSSRIAAIVHDLDLKDGRFGAPECGAVGRHDRRACSSRIRTTMRCSRRA